VYLFLPLLAPEPVAPHVPVSACGAPQEDLRKIAPLWMNVSFTYMSDPEIVKQFEWVLEM